MKILPLAKIAAAKKRLIERPKEMKMTKIDVEALIAQVDDIAPATWNEFSIEFSRLIIDQCIAVAKAQEFYPDTHTGTRQQWVKDEIAKKLEALKP